MLMHPSATVPEHGGSRPLRVTPRLSEPTTDRSMCHPQNMDHGTTYRTTGQLVKVLMQASNKENTKG